jgi:mannose-6-phosphate isomerase-like protein (cupin superfamily)
MRMKLRIALLTGLLGWALMEGGAATNEPVRNTPTDVNAAVFKNLPDIKWDKILPDLGADSPEISILHVDPRTQATKLLVRTSKAIHIRKHWHTANETHTIITGIVTFACDGNRIEMGPGSFNYMPAKMVHEAWLPANSLTFITVDSAWDVNWVEGPPTAADLTK